MGYVTRLCGGTLDFFRIAQKDVARNKQLMYGLAAKGHNVTALTIDVDKNAPKNVHFIQLKGIHDTNRNDWMNEGKRLSPFQTLYNEAKLSVKSCEMIYETNGFARLLNYPDDFRFDLIINTNTVGPCVAAVAQHKFKLSPLMTVTASSSLTSTSFSTIPNQHFDSTEDMCFLKRAKNFLYNTWEYFLEQWYVLPAMDKLARKIFPDIQSVGELSQLVRIRLINANAAIQYPEAASPDVIPVGGLHIQKSESLSKELQKVLDDAPNGVIFCSLGSDVNSETLSDVQVNAVLNAIKQLSQYHFLWQFELKTLPDDVPKNVRIQPRFPQNDLLAHPHMKLFIAESSVLNSQDAIWYGVPMIGIPLAVTQYRNINYGVKQGVAKRLSFADIEAGLLKSAIEEVMTNVSFLENTQLMSKTFHDQPDNPLDRAIWWIEWVVRNPHVDRYWRSTGSAAMCWITRNGYDVLLVVFATIAISMHILTGLIYRVFFKKQSKKVKTKRE
ncbi:UDP-glucosyltransferase 2-like [Sabethes cyaneus]|uniref:UDP-glucosyltransferase 2-like n=1 Tax=Sabethes cyaneus TaxID=53552 RepID=UPI00237DAEBE|nr:UDP-glucosyltransferase 2-like [Sabethes cyaneus]